LLCVVFFYRQIPYILQSLSCTIIKIEDKKIKNKKKNKSVQDKTKTNKNLILLFIFTAWIYNKNIKMYKMNKNFFKVNSYNVLNLNYFLNLKLFIPLSIGTGQITNCNVIRGLSTLTPTNIDQINKNQVSSDTINSNKAKLILSLAKKNIISPVSSTNNSNINFILSNHDKLKIASNKRIQDYPHPKIDPKLSQSQSITYNFNTFNSNLHNKKRVSTILEYFFHSFFSSISKPVFIETPDKLILRLYYVIGTVLEYCSPQPTNTINTIINKKKNNTDYKIKSTAPLLGKGTYMKKHLSEKLAQIIDYVMKNINKKAPQNKKALWYWKIIQKRKNKLNKACLNGKLYNFNNILAYAFKMYKLNKIRRNKTRFKSTLVFPLKKTQELKQKVKGKWYYIIGSNQKKVSTFQSQSNNTVLFSRPKRKPNFNFKNLMLQQNISNSIKASDKSLNVNKDYWWLKIGLLKSLLLKIFQKELEVQLVRLYNIGHDPNILARSISANTKTFNFRFLLTKLWKKISVYKSSKIILQKNRILKNITFSSAQLLPIENYLLKPFSSIHYVSSDVNMDLNSNNNSNISSTLNKDLIPFYKYINKLDNTGLGYSKDLFITKKKKLVSQLTYQNSNKLKLVIPSSILYDNMDNYKEVITNPVSPAKTTGIRIRLAGRLKTERFKPKKTVQTVQIGSLSKNLVNFVNTASFTAKNKKGTFNITVWLSSSYY